jgi:hypothetical protein
VVVEVQRSSILFIYIGVPHVKNLEILFAFLILSAFHEFIAFLLRSLVISSSVCYGEIRELHA